MIVMMMFNRPQLALCTKQLLESTSSNLKLQKWIWVNAFKCSNWSKSSTTIQRYTGNLTEQFQIRNKMLSGHYLATEACWRKQQIRKSVKVQSCTERNLPKSPVRPRNRQKILHSDKHTAAVRKTDVNPAPTCKTKYKWQEILRTIRH